MLATEEVTWYLLVSSGDASRGNADGLIVFGARARDVVGGLLVCLGAVFSAAREADTDRCPAGRSTRSSARRDRLLGLTEKRLTVVTTSDRQPLLFHTRR